jgi:3-methyladenine DNA glycosylase AlkD
MDKTVRERLFSMSEEKYRDFSKALIPGCDNMLGVRVPLIRKYARELIKENEDWRGLLEEDDLYFEETMLRGFITGIAMAKEDDARKKLNEFLPYINNWSINDGFCKEFRIIDKHHDEFINDIEKMTASKKEYVARAGLVLLLEHYVKIDMAGNKIARKKTVDRYDIDLESILTDEGVIEERNALQSDSDTSKVRYNNEALNSVYKGKYTDKILELVNRDFSKNGYYTQMAAGWLIAELFVVYPKEVWDFLNDKNNLKLDEVSYKKAIRKICESKIPTKQLKKYIVTVQS